LPNVVRRWIPLLLGGLGLVVFLNACQWASSLPVAHFSMEPSTGMSPLLVRFDATASSSPAGAITQYLWDFGDGSTGIGMAAGHLYTAQEIHAYTVTLTVTDREGHQATASGTVTVHPEPPPTTASVEFVWPFHFDASGEDAANLNDEYFALQNSGTVGVDMTGWTVENERGVRFRFPDGFFLAPEAFVYVHSGSGADSSGILYWNATGPIWHNTTDIAVLRDSGGEIVDVYAYGGC